MHYSNNNYHPNVIFRNITATVAGCMSMNIQRYLHIFDGHCLLQLRNINFIIFLKFLLFLKFRSMKYAIYFLDPSY